MQAEVCTNRLSLLTGSSTSNNLACDVFCDLCNSMLRTERSVPFGIHVPVVFGSRSPSKVGEMVVTPVGIQMSTDRSLRSWSDKRQKNENMDAYRYRFRFCGRTQDNGWVAVRDLRTKDTPTWEQARMRPTKAFGPDSSTIRDFVPDVPRNRLPSFHVTNTGPVWTGSQEAAVVGNDVNVLEERNIVIIPRSAYVERVTYYQGEQTHAELELAT